MNYMCPANLPQCTPHLWQNYLGGQPIEAWQIAFLIGVWAVCMMLIVVITGAVLYLNQRGRA